ncbi:hypothetical protein ACFO0N_08450 [Halobium salinum]|uniref:Uncharacterized protein n=1 Tax=Halobium salinum TaxID=1364940 RepID=A0ABD5PAN1_9EURY|nr:hypothetical protein [Halobium salinum]
MSDTSGNGIRRVDDTTDESGNQSVEVEFGPHHRVRIEETGDDVRFHLVSTHHGFEASASGDPPTELEELIETVRESHPELASD